MSLGAAARIMDDYALLASGAALAGAAARWWWPAKRCRRKPGPRRGVAVPGLLTTANLLLTLHGGFQGPRREMLSARSCPPWRAATRTWA